MVRVRFEGRRYDMVEYELNVSAEMTDREIITQLARFFDVRAERLSGYLVKRSASGHLEVRPDGDIIETARNGREAMIVSLGGSS